MVELDKLAESELCETDLSEYLAYKAQLLAEKEPEIEAVLRGMIAGCVEESYR